MTEEKVIVGLDGCPACVYTEGYLERQKEPEYSYFKYKPGDPVGEKMMDTLEKVGIVAEEFPFCVEIEKTEIKACDATPLLKEVQTWYDKVTSEG